MGKQSEGKHLRGLRYRPDKDSSVRSPARLGARMTKYLIASSLFVMNCEILSWFALLAIVAMAIVDFFRAVEKERARNGE